MHDDTAPPTEPVASPLLTRRRVLVAGAAVGSAVALRGFPALGQEAEGDFGPTSSTSSTTAPPATTAPSTTTTPPSRPPTVLEPVHPDDAPLPEQRDGYETNLSESPNRGIMFPIFPNSATTWTRNQDTYGACRSGCSRRHQGEDLMAPKMTKLLAVTSGTVVELRHRSGGNTLYIRGDDGWYYGYLHINNDTPGTDNASNQVANAWGPGLRGFATSATTMNETAARGHRVRQGEVVAYCGDSGNAEGTGSHLHFEIRKPEGRSVWDSPAVNPRESLRAAIPAREGGSVPAETFRPWSSSAAFLTYQYQDFLGRAPSASDSSFWGEQLDSGSRSPETLMQIMLESDECDGKAHCIARLYQAFYLRTPDTSGFLYWMDRRRNRTWSIPRIAEQFSRTGEFTRMYGSLDDGAYVDLLYRNALGRTADAAGRQHWIDQLSAGMTRGRVMTAFSDSAEFRAAQDDRMHIIAGYGIMLNRMPTPSELSSWLTHLGGGGSTRDMVAMLRQGTEYSRAVAA